MNRLHEVFEAGGHAQPDLSRHGRAHAGLRPQGRGSAAALLLLALLLPEAALAAQDSPRSGAQSKWTASNAAAGDTYGFAVDIDGGTAIVSAPETDHSGTGGVGTVYVYERQGGVWQETAQLIANDPRVAQVLGEAVSLHSDLVAAGAPLDGMVQGDPVFGAAYVFQRSGGTWSQVAKFKPTDVASMGWVGSRVEVGDGRVLVSSMSDDTHGPSTGAVYLLEEVAGTWTQVDKLYASDPASHDDFGAGLAIRGDTILVGAPGDDDLGSGSGSVYVFREIGGAWQQVAKLHAPNGSTADEFGTSIALEGSCAVIGAPGTDHGVPGSDRGSAYVFEEVAGSWQQVAELVASDGATDDFLGKCVGWDGQIAVVASENADSAGLYDDEGAAYLFTRDHTGAWVELERLAAFDAAPGDHFACGVAVSGGTVICGAEWDDDHGTSSGSAYLFEQCLVGEPFCFGTVAQGNPCPCGNDNDGSDPLGAGCAHGASTAGARLHASGVASITADTLLLEGVRGPVSNTTMFFQADNDKDGTGVFLGDGIRCAGGGLVRLKVKATDVTGYADSSPMVISARSASLGHSIQAGETLYYQWWFRDPAGSPCGTESNTSNGYRIVWLP